MLGVLKDAGATTDNALARRWQWTISLWKNQGLNGAQAEAAAADEHERSAARVMQRYEERLAAYQAVDFDDLIGLPLRLLQTDAEVRAKWQGTLRYLLVDEVQDTNATQYELLRLLADPQSRLFTAVGDDDQSIYGWRGATIENLKRLPLDYPALKVIALEQNYRSTGAILRAANAVIANNPKLFEKKLWSEFGDGEPVAVLECDSEEHEAERAVARVQVLRASGGSLAAAPGGGAVKFGDFAILYRANHQARVFEQKLRAAQIPYKVSGGQSFFDRAEIRDLCAWLRLLVNDDDDPAFLRAVTTPKRGIGHQTLASLGEFAGKWKMSLFEALFADSLTVGAEPQGDRIAARVRPLRERPRVPRPPHPGRRRREGAAARLAEGHRLRAAPARRRRQREARRGALGQRARLRRLDRAALRRRDRRRRRPLREREEEPARRGADRSA